MTDQVSDASAPTARSSRPASSTFSSPLQLLLITAFAVFAGEVIVMFILAVIPKIPMVPEAFLDGVMVTVLVTPFLYLFLFRPMVLHIAERRTAGEALEKLNRELEERVERRTADLANSNATLKQEIEERRSAEHQLIKTNDFVKRLVESAPCMLLIYDVDTMSCTYVNSTVAELLGYAPEQLQRAEERMFSWILEDDERTRLIKLTRNLTTSDEDAIRTRIRLKNIKGTQRSCRARMQVFSRSPTGQPTQILFAAVETEADDDR